MQMAIVSRTQPCQQIYIVNGDGSRAQPCQQIYIVNGKSFMDIGDLGFEHPAGCSGSKIVPAAQSLCYLAFDILACA